MKSAGITDSNLKKAVNDFVIELKDKGLWSNMTAVYPLLGRSSSTMKLNLIDINKFPISLGESSSFNNDGIVFNLNNPYINFGPIGTGDLHLSLYILKLESNDYTEIGAGENVNNGSNFSITIPYQGNIFFKCGNVQALQSNINDSRGFYIFDRYNISQYIFLNAKRIGQSSNKTSTTEYGSMYLNRYGGAPRDNSTTYSFISFGKGLSTTDAASLYDVVISFLSKIGRVYS